jgi:hypothetical protein
MPDLVYPGVYVEEVSAGAESIPGVTSSIDEATLVTLATEFRHALKTHVPEWTGETASDPGITLLEIFAFLAESLLWRANAIPERERSRAMRAAAALKALGHASEAECGSLRRPAFFTGRLLDAATLEAEQEYHREKLRRHNRALLGYGVVSGLSVRVESDSGTGRIVVEPGYAIDRRGEEICVCGRVAFAAPANGDNAFVTLRYWERVSLDAGRTPLGPVSIEEACVIAIGPSILPPAIALARLVRSEGRWQVDPAFAPPRARRPEP